MRLQHLRAPFVRQTNLIHVSSNLHKLRALVNAWRQAAFSICLNSVRLELFSTQDFEEHGGEGTEHCDCSHSHAGNEVLVWVFPPDCSSGYSYTSATHDKPKTCLYLNFTNTYLSNSPISVEFKQQVRQPMLLHSHCVSST